MDMQKVQDMSGPFSGLCEMCREPAQEIRQKKDLLVVSHIDADGLTSAAIICTALERAGLNYRPIFFRQLDEPALDEISDYNPDLVIFTDLGSGMIQQICDRALAAVVVDHHKPASSQARPMAHINPPWWVRMEPCIFPAAEPHFF